MVVAAPGPALNDSGPRVRVVAIDDGVCEGGRIDSYVGTTFGPTRPSARHSRTLRRDGRQDPRPSLFAYP